MGIQEMQQLNVVELTTTELYETIGGASTKSIFDFIDKEWVQIKKAISDAYGDVFDAKPKHH